MAILDTLKGSVNTAVDTIATVTQNLVEKNRINAKLNRLRFIMKNESELMNRAYIALGKQYYENKKGGSAKQAESEEKLFDVIESSKAKIAKARECYRQIVDSQNDIFYGKITATEQKPAKVDSENLVDITVACSNENEYENSPFAEDVKEKTEEIKEEISEKTEDAKQEALDMLEKLEGKAEEVKEEIEQSVENAVEDTEASSEELF